MPYSHYNLWNNPKSALEKSKAYARLPKLARPRTHSVAGRAYVIYESFRTGPRQYDPSVSGRNVWASVHFPGIVQWFSLDPTVALFEYYTMLE